MNQKQIWTCIQYIQIWDNAEWSVEKRRKPRTEQ